MQAKFNNKPVVMEIISRRIREIGSASFSRDETRIVTLDRYVTVWDAATLERVFRVRPLQELSGLEFQPGGELMLSRHATGHYALMEARTGAVLATCGDGRRFLSDARFALSACGKFVIEATRGELRVREIWTNEVVWRRPLDARRILPLERGRQWAVFLAQGIEVWSWPFADAPLRTIPLPGFSYQLGMSGTRVVYSWHREIRALDVADGRPIFSIARDDFPGFQWSGDGSLIVTKLGCLEVYDGTGVLTRAVHAPDLQMYGHAFSASGDSAVLCYHDGIVRVRGFRELVDLPAPWISREPGEAKHLPHDLVLPEPAEERVVEVQTPQELEAELVQFRRPSWKPVARAGRGPVDGSKFGGVPWIGESEEWPRCGRCDGRMDLFLQLNSKDLPAECPPLFNGLLQVFVCTHTTYSATCALPHDSFANWTLSRVVGDYSSAARYVDPPDDFLFDEECIVGWSRQDDFPHFYELDRRGFRLEDHARDMQIEGEFDFPRSGDKLLGWAKWEQDAELVGCPRCGSEMRILFQIDDCCGVPVMLGDGGIGWVSQCPQHPDVVTFHWSCG